MPPPDAVKLLQYLQNAAELILQFIETKDFAGYNQNVMLQSAVERQLIVVGEAVNVLSRLNPEAAFRITDYPRIIAFRNRLVHTFFTVDNRIVWQVVNSDIITLYREASELLREFEDN
jgi:uncharacterized protein with HEPN domain